MQALASSCVWWRSECRAEIWSTLPASSARMLAPSRMSLHSTVSILRCKGGLSLYKHLEVKIWDVSLWLSQAEGLSAAASLAPLGVLDCKLLLLIDQPV